MATKKPELSPSRQEDKAINKVLLWIMGTVVLEMVLLFLNRSYANSPAVGQTGTERALPAFLIIFALCFVLFLFLSVRRHQQGGAVLMPGFLAVVAAALAACFAVAWTLGEDGVKLLYIAVPVVAVLALIYYLYQREFFCISLLSVLGMFGIHLLQSNIDYGAAAYVYAIALAVFLIAVALLTHTLSKGKGTITMGGKRRRVLPKEANYVTVYVSCILVALIILGGFFLSGSALLYGAMVTWLLVMAVYYTVRMM